MGNVPFRKWKRVGHDPERKQRKCMCCAKMFESEWIGNRMCERCKERELVSIGTAQANRERV